MAEKVRHPDPHFPAIFFWDIPTPPTNRPFLSAPQAEAIVCRLYQEVDGEEKGGRHFRISSSVRFDDVVGFVALQPVFSPFFPSHFFSVVRVYHPGWWLPFKDFFGNFHPYWILGEMIQSEDVFFETGTFFFKLPTSKKKGEKFRRILEWQDSSMVVLGTMSSCPVSWGQCFIAFNRWVVEFPRTVFVDIH